MDRLGTSGSSFALVVEGSSIVRMDAATILENAGFRVLDVATCEQANQLLRQHGSEFVLLVTSAGFDEPYDGFALARSVASDYPHMSIAVASGHYTPIPGDLPDKACFIAKPFSAKIVHDHLRRIIPDDKKPLRLKT